MTLILGFRLLSESASEMFAGITDPNIWIADLVHGLSV
jgi:hypothetical protein